MPTFKEAYKVLAVTIGGAIVGTAIYFLYSIGAFHGNYTKNELINHFNKKQSEIYTLKQYFNSIVPKDYFVEIEFTNDKELDRLGIRTNKNNTYFLDWNLKINTPDMDAKLATIGWSRVTIKTLKEKLDDANCIGIETGEPSKIDFKRVGLGMYSFNVFDNPITDSIRALYKDQCTYIIANDRLILEYGGGAIGPQCFPQN